MNEHTKHTPGPWFACCKNTAAHYVFAGDGDATICSPMHNDPDRGEYEPMCATVTFAERLANAQLIAAAPELLDSLADVLALARIKWGNLDADANTAFELAESRLAKATGRDKP